MKFGHILRFNVVEEWRPHYIHYAALKKIIFEIARLEQEQKQAGAPEGHVLHTDEEPLLHGHANYEMAIAHKENELVAEMDRELADIIAFTLRKEAEMASQLESLDLEVHSLEKQQLKRHNSGRFSFEPPPGLPTLTEEDGLLGMEDKGVQIASGGGAGDKTPLARATSATPNLDPTGASRLDTLEAGGPPLSPLSRTMSTSAAAMRPERIRIWAASKKAANRRRSLGHHPHHSDLQQRFIELFTGLNDLVEYLQINREGFRKVIKKHDKLTSSSLKETYWPLIEERYPEHKKDVLHHHIDRLVDLYSILYENGDVAAANESLSQNLRQHIKVERNTVWRDMVAMERRTVAATVDAGPQVGGRRAWLMANKSTFFLLLCIGTFLGLLMADLFEEPEKSNCAALLAFVSLLWATEAIPLFATALLVPPLAAVLRVLVDTSHPNHPERMSAPDAANAIFHAMFSQVTMLLLGGFSIAAALSKHFIAKQMAVAVLSRVGRVPRNVLLASMFVAAFASMWISNVAAPVLCFSLFQPILRTMDVTTPFAKSLVMGVALASNIGGMTSPISSPQNIFAIERMSMDGLPPSWLSWFAVALPVSFISILACWLLLLLVYRPGLTTMEVRPLKPYTDPMNMTQVYVILVSVVTVALWCANTFLQHIVGNMGVVAVLPMVAFFGSGVLSKDDFNGFLWNVVMLAMGGSALGESVRSSGLLSALASNISEQIAGMDLWTIAAIFCGVVLVCATFISHTVAAMVILPIVQSVGEAMPGHPHPKLLVMATGLTCSAAMGLPVSGFPNMNAVALEDGTGQTFVGTLDFLKVGIPSSIAAYFVIISVGHVLMQLVGF